jgi:ABC-type hemin transport system ATPase subunit
MACDRRKKACWESLSWLNGSKLETALINYEVTKWDDKELKAESALICQTTELTFIVGGTEVIKVIRNGGMTKPKDCPADHHLANPIVMKLTSPQDAAKTLKN